MITNYSLVISKLFCMACKTTHGLVHAYLILHCCPFPHYTLAMQALLPSWSSGWSIPFPFSLPFYSFSLECSFPACSTATSPSVYFRCHTSHIHLIWGACNLKQNQDPNFCDWLRRLLPLVVSCPSTATCTEQGCLLSWEGWENSSKIKERFHLGSLLSAG